MMDFTNATIAVTGAGGFVGHSLCRKLFERGARVRMLVRYRSNSPGEYQCDLANNILDPAALEPPIRAVVHCAWDTKTRAAADYKRTNVEGTQWLVERCRQAGVEQFVFVSSLTAQEEARSIYGQSKWEVEKRLLSLENAATFSTVVAPGLVVGNGGAFALSRATVKKIPLVPVCYPLGGRRLQTVFVDELCDAIIKTIADRITGRLVMAEDRGITLSDFYRGLAALVEKRPLLFPFPGDVALAAMGLLELTGLKPPIAASTLKDIKQLRHVDVGASNKRLDVPSFGTYWQSLERLAIQENKAAAAEKIRQLASRAG